MQYLIRFFMQEQEDNFEKLSMEVIYQIAQDNLSLLENLTLITLAFFLSFLLFCFFHFKLDKPLLARRVLFISLLTLMGVGWPVTLYYAFFKNTTPAILILGFFTLLVINIYLFLIYWVNPLSPGEPLKRAEKIWGGVVLLITAFNLFQITCASLAQGIIMIQAWSAKHFTDMVALELSAVDLEDKNRVEGSLEKPSASVFIPCPQNTEQIVPLSKPTNWFLWRTAIIDPAVKDLVNLPSQEKTVQLQHDVMAAITGKRGPGDIYDINELIKKIGINPGNTIAGLYKHQYMSNGKLHELYFACAEKRDLVQGTHDYNQEKSWFQRKVLRQSGQVAVPYKQGCLALAPKADGGMRVLKGTLNIPRISEGLMEKVDSFTWDSKSPLSTCLHLRCTPANLWVLGVFEMPLKAGKGLLITFFPNIS